MASLYLSPDLDPDAAPGSVVHITGAEARHAITVARLRVGERIAVGDGAGLIVQGTVRGTDDGVTVVVESVSRESTSRPELWLAQALAKGDRDELAVQAATELGVSGVVPWAAERSISRWDGAKVAKGRERWRAIVREASKQSLRARVPEVAEMANLAQLTALPGRVLVLEPTADMKLTELELTGTAWASVDRITLVVGPEGGLSPHELGVFADAGATTVRLGSEVLRTSTAGPAALAVLLAKLGRW